VQVEQRLVTFKVHMRTTEFLDTIIYTTTKPGDPNTKMPITRVYFKPTDTHQLLYKISHHPKHTTIGILKSQFLRFKRICHSYTDYSSACSTLNTESSNIQVIIELCKAL